MRKTRWALAAALMVSVVALADAQQPQQRQRGQGGAGGFGGGFGRGTGDLSMTVATNKALQEELKVTEEQVTSLKEKMKPVQDKMREMFTRGGGNPQNQTAEERAKMTEERTKLRDESRKAAAEVLKPEQMARLKQIQLQASGVTAFSEEEVQTALKLTDEQKSKLKGIGEEFTKDRTEMMREAFQGFQPGQQQDPAKMQERMQDMQKKTAKLTRESMAKASEVLNDDQQATWKKMVGEAFDMAKLQQGFGGPGGTGGNRRPGGNRPPQPPQ